MSGEKKVYKNPIPVVDIVIEVDGGIVLVRRNVVPIGWALPGGHVDDGESYEHAARREAKEETGLDVELYEQFFTYSDPKRDPRKHTASTVFLARAKGVPEGADDADEAKVFPLAALPRDLCFDHAEILGDYRRYKETGVRRKI